MQLPLDIDLEQLRLPMPQLEIEVEKLDVDGWNTAAEYRSNLYPRSLLICSMIQEDILEIALGSLPNDNIAIAENILQRSRSAWDSFPDWIRNKACKANDEGFVVALLNHVCLRKRPRNTVMWVLSAYNLDRLLSTSNTASFCYIELW